MKTMKLPLALISICLLLSVTAAIGAREDIRFRTMQVTDGLSNNHVNAIMRDSQGFMWFGTASGLNRYDGFSIKEFQNNPSDSLSLHDNYVQSIEEDSLHRLWICAGDIYSIFDPETERFHRLGFPFYKELGMKASAQLVRVDGENLWLWGRNDGLYHAAEGKARKLMDYDSRREVTSILVDEQGNHVYIAENGGSVRILDRNTGRPLKTLVIPDHKDMPLTYTLFLDNRKRLWAYCEYGAQVYDTLSGNWLGPEILPTYNTNAVKAVNEDANGDIWIGYDNDGVEVKRSDGTKEFLRSDINDPHSLGNNSVESIFYDPDGGMWVATYKRGVSVYYPSEYKFQIYALGDVNCIVPVSGNGSKVYVGTDHGELMTFDLSTHQTVRIPVPGPYGKRAITAMATGDDGTLWVGTYKGGMYSFRGGIIRHYSQQEGLLSANVWSIVVDPKGKLWIGTLGSGVQCMNLADGSFHNFNVSNSGLTSDFVSCMTLGKDGNIYVGATDGVSIIDPSTETVRHLDGFRQQGISYGSLNVNQLMCDSRGLLWIATREGLFVYDNKNDKTYSPQLRPSSNTMFINGVIEGADGTVWVTSGSTLYSVSVEDSAKNGYKFNPYAFGVEDGLSGTNFNQRSLCLTPDGEVLVGFLGGILVVDPYKLQTSARNPEIKFVELSVGNTPVVAGHEYGGRVILKKALPYVSELKLGAKQNDITVSFSIDSYQRSSREVFEYMLEGYDDSWRTCPRGVNYAHYMKLPPGNYTLKVRLSIPGLPSDRIMGELKILIAKPWYARWWMVMIYVLTAAGLILLGLWLVRRRERRKYQERQRRELERKELELNELKFKFFTNVSHDLRTPLTLILSPVESLLNEKTDEHDIKRLTTIKRNANRLLYLVNQLLDFRKKDMAGLSLNLSNGDIVRTVEKAVESFMDMADRRDIDLEFKSGSPCISMAYDEDKVTKCVMNLLSNAVKFTPDKGCILVTVLEVNGSLEIAVADSGAGVSDKDKKHIFERFYMGEDKSGNKTGTGIGLSLVFEYVSLHGGSVKVDDNKPCGAKFVLVLPMNLKSTVDAAQESPEEKEQSVPKIEESNEKNNNGRPRILFVDDNRDLTDFLRDEFGKLYEVDTAPDGEVAEKMARAKNYDLIVTDIMMPKVDGIQLTRTLKSEAATSNVPVIMLTAKQDVSSVVEGLSLGADDYVTKPFNNDVLALKIKRLVSLRKQGVRRSYIEPTPEDIEITPLDQQLIGKAVKYVENNMGRSDLTVEELSRELGMSRVHLYKKLLALTGKSPIEFIRVLRLKRAAQYLRESQMNVSEIAYQLGFNNPKYFSKYFKDEYGMTPSEYQEKTQK